MQAKRTPLLLTAHRGLPKIGQYLLQEGATVTYSVLRTIGLKAHAEWIPVLQECKVNLNGYSAAILHGTMSMCYSTYSDDVREGFCQSQRDMVEKLLSAGVNPNIKHINEVGYASGSSPGHTAASSQQEVQQQCHLVEILINHGWDINSRDNDGHTVLHLAAKQRNDCLQKLLIDSGASVDVRDESGSTPLLCLIESHKSVLYLSMLSLDEPVHHMIWYFIEHGADVNATNLDGFGVLDGLLSVPSGYHKELTYVLFSTGVILPKEVKNEEILDLFALSRLIQAGCMHRSLLQQLLMESIRENRREGYSLVLHANPTFIYKSPLLAEDGSELYEVYANDRSKPPSLIAWCVYTLRRHLVSITEGKSLIPTIVSMKLPAAMEDLMTLKCFTVETKAFGEDRNPEDFVYRTYQLASSDDEEEKSTSQDSRDASDYYNGSSIDSDAQSSISDGDNTEDVDNGVEQNEQVPLITKL